VTGPALGRFEQALRKVVGLDDAEVAARLAAVREFCRRHDTDPDTVLSGWTSYDELTVRRRSGAMARDANLVMESFLVHNGINVFGDLVCVPRSTEHLREQWRPDRLGTPQEREGP
jgi:hypothetical protein